MPLNLTVSLAFVVLKLVPVMVTLVLTPPEVGLKLVTVGFGSSVKVALLVAIGEFNTAMVIFPVLAPGGTVAISCVAVADVTVACIPLNLTVLLTAVVPKFVPVIVTEAPMPVEEGVKLVIVGTVTVKLALLVPVPPVVVTVTVPVVVADSTVALICVVDPDVTVAAVP